jgi:hypothetical protein
MLGGIRLVAAFVIATLSLSPLQASIINTFDNLGDVILSPTQAPGTWYVDRYPPAGFAAGQIGGGRTGCCIILSVRMMLQICDHPLSARHSTTHKSVSSTSRVAQQPWVSNSTCLLIGQI